MPASYSWEQAGYPQKPAFLSVPGATEEALVQVLAPPSAAAGHGWSSSQIGVQTFLMQTLLTTHSEPKLQKPPLGDVPNRLQTGKPNVVEATAVTNNLQSRLAAQSVPKKAQVGMQSPIEEPGAPPPHFSAVVQSPSDLHTARHT